MSSILGYNKNTIGGMLINEEVFGADNLTLNLAQSVSRAVVDHLIYYLRSFFSDVVFQYSATSGNTSVTIYGKYPENYANANYPCIIIYVQNNMSKQQFIGDIASANPNGETVSARRGDYEIIFDVWGRTQLEVEAVSGAVIRIFDDANHDLSFLKRGFSDAKYFGTLGREFDITDKIVQTVSHLDSSINVRREQVVIRAGFFYRIAIPRASVEEDGTYITNAIMTVENTVNGTVISITPTKKLFIQGMAISSE